ncbi:MAG: RNA polymerase sigma factor [Gammaproteobacteria bacterium]|nr:MAG: RNA polymerase sigma factor [Gammaproteobacteria bacterium]
MDSRVIEEIFRHEGGRVLATLIRLLGDFDLAEEARQEAFATAIEQWPATGIPENARAWLVHVGRNKGIDHIRRQALLREKVAGLASEGEEPSHGGADDPAEADGAAFADDRLRLIFTCCHPALSLEAQVALTLHTVCDLESEEVARAFLVSQETMWQRLGRAKRKIREANIPYETPPPALLNERVDGVLAVIYLVFSEGYAVTSGAALVREDLCREAIRLGRLLDALLPGRADVRGLLALMLLHDARRKARVSATGDIVLLEEQDRSLWDRAQIAEGLALVDQSLRTVERISAYAVQAAIVALHATAERPEATDWRQIVGLYEVLLRIQPTPVIELNHTVAVSMVDGPARALDLIDSLAARSEISGYHLLRAVRARLLQQLGKTGEARAAYQAARGAVAPEPERRLLERRLRELPPDD